MHTVLKGLALFLLLTPLPIYPVQQSGAMIPAPGCPSTVFSGTVQAGHEFEKRVADGLVFRLARERGPATAGWTIQIHEETDSERARDFLMVATPPYRSWNPRYLHPSHEFDSAERIVEMNRREFSFVSDREGYEAFWTALRTWNNYGPNEQEKIEATEFLLNAPRCSGVLLILDSEIRPSKDGKKEIVRLKFRVELGQKKVAKP